jgi:hypothetical protein
MAVNYLIHIPTQRNESNKNQNDKELTNNEFLTVSTVGQTNWIIFVGIDDDDADDEEDDEEIIDRPSSSINFPSFPIDPKEEYCITKGHC